MTGRRCLREPIPESFEAAELPSRAVDAHLLRRRDEVDRPIRAGDMKAVRGWTGSLWGTQRGPPDRITYAGFRADADALVRLAKPDRIPRPDAERCGEEGADRPLGSRLRLLRHARHLRRGADGHAAGVSGCLAVGDTDQTQYAGFQCLWWQYDHLLPHSRGGGNGIDNVAITCAPCNYGRGFDTLDLPPPTMFPAWPYCSPIHGAVVMSC